MADLCEINSLHVAKRLTIIVSLESAIGLLNHDYSNEIRSSKIKTDVLVKLSELT